MMMRSIGILAACAIAVACGADNAVVVFPTGTMVLDWTVASTKDPNLCAINGATTIDISVSTVMGASAGGFQQDCEAFATSIALPAGTYVASAVLLDASGAARTTSVEIAPFSIFGNDQVLIPINFPRASFF
jgi:hypothetical protein